MKKTVAVLGWVALTTLAGCGRDNKPETRTDGDGGNDLRVAALMRAEATRDPSGVSPADLSSPKVVIRRAAIRALARIASADSLASFERSLSDEDSEVVAWAAFGLGRICSPGTADAVIQRITARAGTLLLTAAPGSAAVTGAVLDPWFSFAQALGRCGVPESERILHSWMTVSPELSRLAVQGLDYYVQQTKVLDASTIVALLDAAESDRGSVIALLPISRLTQLEPLAARRLVGLAPRVLETAGDSRRFLLRALPLVGESVLPILERVVVDDGHYQPLERVEAIRAIGKLGAVGQAALARLVPRVVSLDTLPTEAWLLSPRWALAYELFEQLKEAAKGSRAYLAKLASFELADGTKPAMARRVGYLRCRAAALLSDEPWAPLLESCDPLPERRNQKLAQLSVLDRQTITAKRMRAFEGFAADRDPVVAMAALSMLSNHGEIQSGPDLVTAAFGAEFMGIVATAARFVTEHPERTGHGKQSSLELSMALERALAKDWPADAVEVRIALIDAAARLGLLSTKPRILKECKNPVPAIRQHAETGLHQLGEPKQKCPAPSPRELPKEVTHPKEQARVLRFDTDVGRLEIELERTLAPIASQRLVDLVKAGFYDGVVVHRVIAGFVAQLGDRSGDGYAGAGQLPIPCELAPRPFGPRDVGMALSGADSGSSQFFVTLGPYPQLGDGYTGVGRATGAWDQLFLGDRIHHVEVVP